MCDIRLTRRGPLPGRLFPQPKKELDNSHPLLWRELAKHMPGRSNKDCRKRWWNSLAGGTAKGVWSAEEDRKLVEAVDKFGTNWSRVASVLKTRSGKTNHLPSALQPYRRNSTPLTGV